MRIFRKRSVGNFVKSLLIKCLKPERKVLRYYFWSRWLYVKGFRFLAQIIAYRQGRYGCYISEKAIIHPSLKLKHPVGVVIGEGVEIEENVLIWQNVTLGSHGKTGLPQTYPYIESGVKIFAGAVVLGGVRVGKNAIIGANCVVLDDVPENGVAVGVPYKQKNKRLTDLNTHALA
jgi:serine O-acetyltransferase